MVFQVLESQSPYLRSCDGFAILEGLGKQNKWTLTLEVSSVGFAITFYALLLVYVECRITTMIKLGMMWICFRYCFGFLKRTDVYSIRFRCSGGYKDRNGINMMMDSIPSSL